MTSSLCRRYRDLVHEDGDDDDETREIQIGDGELNASRRSPGRLEILHWHWARGAEAERLKAELAAARVAIQKILAFFWGRFPGCFSGRLLPYCPI